MFRAARLAFAGLVCAVAQPALAQYYYSPAPAYGPPPGAVYAEPDDVYEAPPPRRGPRYEAPRFYVPFLRGRDVGLEQAPAGVAGAVATSPSGRRVFYVPAPRQEPQVLARAPAGDEDEDEAGYAPAPPAAAPGGAASAAIDPRFRRQEVAFDGPQAPGTIIVNTRERLLYLVQPGGRALRYGIGVGRQGFSWRGEQRISRMAEWPSWTPPADMLRRRPDLPRFMPGGPQNPLGARALYLGATLYRIHGTNEPHTIGQAVSSGCIRMMNQDVMDLYTRVRVGTRVVVL